MTGLHPTSLACPKAHVPRVASRDAFLFRSIRLISPRFPRSHFEMANNEEDARLSSSDVVPLLDEEDAISEQVSLLACLHPLRRAKALCLVCSR